MKTTQAQATKPRVWILSCGRVGDLKQMLALAEALNWPTEVKSIKLLSDSPARFPKMDEASRQSLEGPLPDLLLSAEATASRIALRLKEKSGGKTKAVCLTRPRGKYNKFDLIITTPQYELPDHRNTLKLSLPLTSLPEARGRDQGSSPPEKPTVALLVGGTSPPYVFGVGEARQLAREVLDYAAKSEATITGTTSARTGAAQEDAIAKTLGEKQGSFYFWSRGGSNPYQTLLQTASEFIVTSDSVSMIADVLATGKPVYVYDMPVSGTALHAVVRWLWKRAKRRKTSIIGRLAWPLFNSGLLQHRANRNAMIENLAASRALSWLGDPPPVSQIQVHVQDTQKAVARIRELLQVG